MAAKRAASKVVLSGIQPTGVPHLGNYCGAVSKWVALQAVEPEDVRSLYSIVDLHAITLPYETSKLQDNIHGLLASLLGCGLDPKKSILFKQSDVREHTELAWLLSCITPLSWMQRMTQFKQKSQKNESDAVSLGCISLSYSSTDASSSLLSYPALMAADVLLYKATHVPVGDDQQQHLELARMIATTFNDRFQPHLFPKPIPVRDDPNDALVRIMSLREPTEKMSKSDPSHNSRIDLTDAPDLIAKKIRKAQSDAIHGIFYNKVERPGISNLMSILSAVTDQSVASIEAEYGSYQTGKFKQVVADAVVAKIGPIGERIQMYQQDRAYLDGVLKEGGDNARAIAADTMAEVKAAMGL
ncbi:Aste57867_21313 [Aphanomyces stellatus]|uniref:tryptophan--tRNA ligase n=1 Tax=Aphanomyces stellatus TaxID=120398 RepID=A0A485LHV7_9STRA|nr:hypothetical protein As57867_021244 [Aphanomyces stellatus]VFT97985.1 Aste57867_21313 [Aphanomyces stellatus]